MLEKEKSGLSLVKICRHDNVIKKTLDFPFLLAASQYTVADIFIEYRVVSKFPQSGRAGRFHCCLLAQAKC